MPADKPTGLQITIGVIVILVVGVFAQVAYAIWPVLLIASEAGVSWWFSTRSPSARLAARQQDVEDLDARIRQIADQRTIPDAQEFSRDFVSELADRLGGYPPIEALCYISAFAENIYEAEMSIGHLPRIDTITDEVELARHHDKLITIYRKLQYPRMLELLQKTLLMSFADFFDHLPQIMLVSRDDIHARLDGKTSLFSVPLKNVLTNPSQAIEAIILPYFGNEAFDFSMFLELRQLLNQNLERAEGMMPTARGGEPSELVDLYLGGVIFHDILNSCVDFDFSTERRLEHSVVVAGSGHGKTQTLEALILRDLLLDDPPSMVVIDSKGDMVERIARLDLFNPNTGRLRDRLIIVDCHDRPHLNPFDVKLDETERSDEDATGRVIASMGHFFRSLLGSELSGTMRVALYPFLHLMLKIPGATLQTLIDAMRDPSPYADIIASLPTVPRNYLQQEYARTRPETRNAVKDRIYDLQMTSPAFEPIFGASNNCLDLPSALNQGKIVLVNLDVDNLDVEPSAILGRWIIAQTYRAALRRSKIRDQRQRKPAYLIVDEALPYFDDQTEQLLRTMRSYRVGALFAFQDFGKVSPALQSAIMANTAIRLAGGKVDDPKLAATLVNSTPEFVLSRRKKDHAFSEFACFVHGESPQAINLTIPHGAIDREPRMTNEQYKRLKHIHRTALTAERPTQPEADTARPAPTGPDSTVLNRAPRRAAVDPDTQPGRPKRGY